MIETEVKYIICDGAEQNFLTDPVTKAMSKYRENAYEWEMKKSAEAVLPKVATGCKVIESYTYKADVDDCLMMDVDTIENFLDIIKESQTQIPILERRLEILNRQITDIEHFIQFKDLNVPSGFKIYKKLQEKRRDRAFVKGKLRILRDVRNLKIDDKVLEDLVKLFRQELTYKPRELNFEEML
jgi:hypothetical protein